MLCRKHSAQLKNSFGLAPLLLLSFFFWAMDATWPERQTASPPSGSALRKAGPSISFYYWKTVFNPDKESLSRLDQVRGERLYLRFFEVTLNEEGEPAPQATTVFAQQCALPVVPVVYFENSVFRQDGLDEAALADKLLQRVLGMISAHELNAVKELHLDCDWTPATRERFFAFTAALKNILPPDWRLAITLRLDQFKNFRITGAPPAHKGILMAYNMGDIRQPGRRNSIIDPAVAAQYLKGGAQYPLPLDIALPLFSWVVVFDNKDQFQGLLRAAPPELEDARLCRDDGGGLFSVVKSFQTSGGMSIPAGWSLRLEESKTDDILAVADLLRQAVPKSEFLVFYHLDENIIREWSADDLENIAGRCH
jgi:hypothetical protein